MEQVYELPSQLRRGPILVFANGGILYYSCLYNCPPPLLMDCSLRSQQYILVQMVQIMHLSSGF